jgi:ABC-type branched-subunit amino acid transport system substrate-binding protein
LAKFGGVHSLKQRFRFFYCPDNYCIEGTWMTFQYALVVATTMVFAVPSIGNAGPREEKINIVRQLASRVGKVLGAASSCNDIARPRVRAVTDKMMEVIMASGAGREELASVLETFDEAVAEGERASANGQAVCASTERDLVDLERAAAVTQQPPAPAPAAVPAATVAAPAIVSPNLGSAPAVRGVTDREIRLGISAPFSGPAKELGQQMKFGIEVAFKAANDAGGIHGRQLKLVAADDGYEPTRTVETIKQLAEKEQVFGFVGNVGTPTAAVAVPYALERRMLFFGAFTGASVIRHDPPDRYVFNYRASYAEETDAVVHYLVKVRRLKPEQIAVFAQQDSFGDSGFAGVTKAMRALRGGDGGTILRLNYKRNTVDVDDAVAELKKQVKPPIKAIVMVATYRAAAKFIEKTRDAFPGMIYTNVSFVGSTALASELMLLGQRYAEGVIVTQVVPAVEGYSSLVLEYKNALAKYSPGEAPDYVSLEGYVTASILIEALKRAGPQLDMEKLVETLESMRSLDLGLGTLVNFGRAEHQAIHKVWGTQINASGRYQSIDLQ